MTISRIRSADRSKTEDDRVKARVQHLLEAAGHVFAKKGFEGSTAKEICELAGTNTAAVNYHFGGIEALYAAVLDEARSRILSVRAIELAVQGKTDPSEKLEAALDVIVQTLLGPVSSSWVLQVFGRDMVTPSPTTYAAKEKLTTAFSANLERVRWRVDGFAGGRPCGSSRLSDSYGADLHSDRR